MIFVPHFEILNMPFLQVNVVRNDGERGDESGEDLGEEGNAGDAE